MNIILIIHHVMECDLKHYIPQQNANTMQPLK